MIKLIYEATGFNFENTMKSKKKTISLSPSKSKYDYPFFSDQWDFDETIWSQFKNQSTLCLTKIKCGVSNFSKTLYHKMYNSTLIYFIFFM